MFFSKKLFVLIMTAGLLCAPFVLKAAEKKNNKNPQYEVQEYLEKKAAIVEPGVLPNSFWYWADIFGEEIKYLFTITKESKGDFLIETAAERLAELQALSEQGINKYADKLTTKHEKSISKAEDIFAKLKDEGWEKMQQKQEELEFEILKKEGKITEQAKKAPDSYKKNRDSVLSQIGEWFGKIKNHLTRKGSQIKVQEEQMWE